MSYKSQSSSAKGKHSSDPFCCISIRQEFAFKFLSLGFHWMVFTDSMILLHVIVNSVSILLLSQSTESIWMIFLVLPSFSPAHYTYLMNQQIFPSKFTEFSLPHEY